MTVNVMKITLAAALMLVIHAGIAENASVTLAQGDAEKTQDSQRSISWYTSHITRQIFSRRAEGCRQA